MRVETTRVLMRRVLGTGIGEVWRRKAVLNGLRLKSRVMKFERQLCFNTLFWLELAGLIEKGG
jgi:hypothetical protein